MHELHDDHRDVAAETRFVGQSLKVEHHWIPINVYIIGYKITNKVPHFILGVERP